MSIILFPIILGQAAGLVPRPPVRFLALCAAVRRHLAHRRTPQYRYSINITCAYNMAHHVR
jgi:hypothetical protein